ncbi:MAG: glycosyltransferase [Planctomycetota bacterium]
MRWKLLLRYPLDRAKASKSLRKLETVDPDWPLIGIDLQTDHLLIDGVRHLACLAIAAEQRRYRVTLRCSPLQLAAIAHKRLGSLFLSRPNVAWSTTTDDLREAQAVLCDLEQATNNPNAAKSVHLLLGKDTPADVPALPYPMHPKQMLRWNSTRAAGVRRRRKAGVFFAGNQKPRYGRDRMQQTFGVMPRLEIVQTLRDHFPTRIVQKHATGDPSRIVLRDTVAEPIAEKDWLETLGDHRFFLCCPGAAQPMCHNVIEAMACGVIPIIEYADRFAEPLKDGHNAIIFSGQEGLLDAIDRVDSLSESRLEQMTRHVIEYYEAYLRYDEFVAKMISDPRSRTVAMPVHDKNLFAAHSTTVGSPHLACDARRLAS